MATQNGHYRRHELTPVGGLRKRKVGDVSDAQRGVPVTTKSEPAPTPVGGLRKRKVGDVSDAQRGVPMTTKPEPAPAPAAFPGGGNRLLAGYLAHEFITRGTLFGQRWDPAAKKPPAPGRQECPPPAALPTKPLHQKPRQTEPKQGKPPAAAYAELAYLLRTDGAHIPGVVNPTQLARLLQM